MYLSCGNVNFSCDFKHGSACFSCDSNRGNTYFGRDFRYCSCDFTCFSRDFRYFSRDFNRVYVSCGNMDFNCDFDRMYFSCDFGRGNTYFRRGYMYTNCDFDCDFRYFSRDFRYSSCKIDCRNTYFGRGRTSFSRGKLKFRTPLRRATSSSTSFALNVDRKAATAASTT